MRVEVMLIEDRARLAQVLELILAANTAQGSVKLMRTRQRSARSGLRQAAS